MRSIIVVESEDDKVFIEAIARGAAIRTFEVQQLGGQGQLEKRLEILKNQLVKTQTVGDTIRIGIVLDRDREPLSERFAFVNKALKTTFGVQLDTASTFVKSKDQNVEIACYFVNVDGSGELETLLKQIANRPSPYANCLDSWRKCIPNAISDKEFDKLWIHYYLRWDTATDEDRERANQRIKVSYSMQEKPYIWELDSPLLTPLKTFLNLFQE